MEKIVLFGARARQIDRGGGAILSTVTAFPGGTIGESRDAGKVGAYPS